MLAHAYILTLVLANCFSVWKLEGTLYVTLTPSAGLEIVLYKGAWLHTFVFPFWDLDEVTL